MLYEIIIRVKRCILCKSGYIWCKDGSFISPLKFRNSGKEAYGYALNNYTVVPISMSRNKLEWSKSDSPFYQRIRSAESLTDGVSNSNALKNIYGYSYINCPAIYQCLNYSNAGVKSYMPAAYELRFLYYSIMSGKMKDDLITAGLYEMCNYRENTPSSWGYVWSSTQYSLNKDRNFVKLVSYTGYLITNSKVNKFHVIPFYKF